MHTPLIPTLWRPRQVNPCEFKACVVYKASSRTTRTMQRNPVSGGEKKCLVSTWKAEARFKARATTPV